MLKKEFLMENSSLPKIEIHSKWQEINKEEIVFDNCIKNQIALLLVIVCD